MLSEINKKHILPGVLKPTQHYLTHIPYMIERQGVLRAYSGRSMERTIGRYKKQIKSKVAAGANAGNVLVRFALYTHINRLSIDRRKELDLLEPKPYTNDTFISLDSDDPFSTQLWSPISNIPVSELPCEVTYTKFTDSLRKFLERVFSSRQQLHLPTDTLINVAGRSWFNNTLYSSTLYKNHIHENRRGNNFILFSATHIK